jgi:hypothetical protein
MSNLLLHSMREFAHLIIPCLEASGARHLVEIGAEHGGTSPLLARYAELTGGSLTCVDPTPGPAFLEWLAQAPAVRHLAHPSLEAIGGLAGTDAWLIDGDHNWYTVYHELHAIDALSRTDRKPMLVFLHDVGWPCARRDSYYAPERIPAEFRQPHTHDGGVTLDRTDTVDHRGFRGAGAFAFARHEGGPHNGVLTAVEDFVADAAAQGRRLAWANIPAVFGMGVLYDLDATWSATVSAILGPWHENPLLMSLEENRLRNYLTVIEWQDRQAAAELTA